MLIKRLGECREILALDQVRLRELLHPERDPIDIRYSLAVAWLDVGKKSIPHRLEQAEVYYVIQGRGLMHVDKEDQAVAAGDAVYIPAGAVQWLENNGDTVVEFACIVDPAWNAATEAVANAD